MSFIYRSFCKRWVMNKKPTKVLSQREACNFVDVICVSYKHDLLCLCCPVIVLIISTYKTTIITKLMDKAHHLII